MANTKKAKQIDNRVQSSGKVIRAATTHRNTVAEALAKRAVEVQGPNTKATKEVWLIVQDFYADALQHSTKGIDDAELAVTAERADDVEPRERRDSLENSLTARMVRIRSNVLDAMGPESLKTYGLEGATPRGAREVASHARNVANLMKQKPFHVTLDGMTLDSAGIVASMETEAEKIEAANVDVEREGQELVDAIGRRDVKVEGWGDVYQGVADSLTGNFRLAGRRDLSEWVRPTSRTLSGEEVETDEPGDGTPPGGGGGQGSPPGG
jgi:hypothetical protein